MTQDELDLWIEGCINHYKKNSNKVMATNEERIERLELAHSRLFNDYEVENAEYTGGNSEDVKYRLDKPVIAIYVREDTKELLLMNAPMEQYK